ncbi:MAG: hypothetical protein E4H46_00070 [Desulfobacterales bacterium]|nr:MAG: hypothetical protein E4H46_00070 [Desulfobacterales bacterium]
MSAAGVPADDGAVEPVFTVMILPPQPRATDDLQASVIGVGGPLTFAWRKNGELLAGHNNARLPHLELVHGDLVSLVVAAHGREVSAETVIHNSPPKVTAVTCKVSSLNRGVNLEVEPLAEDADGDPVAFRFVWQVNDEELFGENGPVLSGGAFHKGDIIKLEVVPYDEEDEGDSFTNGLVYVAGNAPPRFVSSPPATFASMEYRYQARAIDPDDDDVRYELVAGPAGMTIDPVSGLVLWPIPVGVSVAEKVRIEARDAEGAGGYQEYLLQLKTAE